MSEPPAGSPPRGTPLRRSLWGWGPVLLLGTVLVSVAGYYGPWPWLLPLSQAALAAPALALAVRAGRSRTGVVLMLIWAAAMGGTVTVCAARDPETGATSVVHGAAYAGEMLHWVRTGEGAEGDIRRFLPQHALHLGVFLGLGVASGGILSLFFGAVLMNYMGYYVGSLAVAAGAPVPAVLLGWHPWSLFRIVAFVCLGVWVARGWFARGWRDAGVWRRDLGLVGVAGLGLVTDVLLKWSAAETWRGLLRSLL